METSKRNAASKLETVMLPYRSITGRFARGTKTALTNGLYRISSDPLQSSSVILDEEGDVISRTTHTAFGEERVTYGVESPTDYGYTG